MKNIICIILLVGISTSCSDFLEEDLSTVITSQSGALSNEGGLLAALAGSYKPLARTWNQGLVNGSTQAILMGGDDLTTHKASNKADFREFDQFKVSQQNGRLPFVWKGAYKSIQGANNIINNYQKATGNQANINQIAGEAYFLRAYNYFWIVRLWGKAPIVLNTDVYDPAILEVSSNTSEELYTQIIEDLNNAIGLLSDKKPQPGRANKGAALGVLAEVYLQMTGYPLNQTDKYALAASTAKMLIDNQATYGFGLLSDFGNLWPNASHNFDGNSEEVFALNFAGTASNFNAIYGLPSRPGDEGAWDDFFTEITFFNEFPSQYRKDITFQTVSYTINAAGDTTKVTAWQDLATGHPYFKKFQADSKTWQNVLSLPLERFAETYFIYAEAQIMSTGNNADPLALEAINKIVRRANKLPLETPNVSVDYTSITQDQLIQEKAWEFAGEYSRWFDLVRLQKVDEVNAKKDPNDLQPLAAVKYFLPLPASETAVNPNLEGD